MTKLYLSTLLALCSVAQLQAQGRVNIELEDATLSLPADAVDLMQSDTLLQRVSISYSAGNNPLVTSDTVAPSAVALNQEKPQSFNVLNTFSLVKADNPALKEDISVALGAQTLALVVLPYLGSVTSLVPSFQTTGAHIFVDGKLWSKGLKVDFSAPVQVKVASFNGDVRTYTIVVSKTNLPYVEVKSTVRTIGKDWVEAKLTIDGTDEGSLSLKGKGSHYGEGQKNNYSLKFENKKSLLGITKNKRWLLVANESDKSLLRSQLGYWLGQQVADGAWIPVAKPANLSVNGQYMGCYTLVEQPRVCKGRIENGFLLSVEDGAEPFDDAFRTKNSNTWMVFEDPETGSKGTGLIRTKDKIDRFEKALEKEDWTTAQQAADMTSLANWLVINEIAYNTDAFSSNTLIHVDDNGKIAMLPVWELKKAFGCETDDVEGWTASATPWMRQLLKNSSFMSLVKQQYAKIKAHEDELKSYIDQQAQTLKEAAVGNNTVWKNLDGDAYGTEAATVYDAETERLKNWIDGRLKWLDSQW